MDPQTERFERYRATGDPQALGACFDLVAPRLLGLALHLLSNPADAEDLVQQTFLLAIERASSFDAARPLEPWLVGLLTNLAHNARRRRARRAVEPLPDLEDPDLGPLPAAERAELLARLSTSIDGLPPEQRTVLRLQLQHGLNAVEIAAALELPPGTVRMRIHRGLQALRGLLPAGLAAVLLPALPALATRGLAAVRAELLRQAALRAAATTAAAAAAAALPTLAFWGGVSLMKVWSVVVAAAAILALLLWSPWGVPPPSASLAPAAAEVALPAVGGTASADAAASIGAGEPSSERTAAVPAPGELRVQVLATGDPEPMPLAGVLVTAWSGVSELEPFDGSAVRLQTGDDGWVMFPRCAPGPWRCELPAQPDLGVTAADVPAGGAAATRIAVAAPRRLRGHVVDANGQRVAGAELWLQRGTAMGRYSMPEPQELECRSGGRSDASGRFAIAVLEREHSITASHPEFGESFGRATDEGEVELRLSGRCGRIVGTVLDDHGQAVASATVRLTPSGKHARRAADGTLLMARGERLLRTDAAGRFVFAGVASGEARVWATAWPRSFANATVAVPVGGEVAADLVLKAGTMVMGHVRHADGRPARAWVQSSPERDCDGHYCHAETREDGSYLLYYQPTRPFFVCVGRRGTSVLQHEVAAPEPGMLRCDLVLPPTPLTATCRGRVLDPDGGGLGAWRVDVRVGEASLARGRTGVDGAFVVDVPADEAFELVATPPGAAAPVAARMLPAGSVQCDLPIPAAALPRGRVRGLLVETAGGSIAAAQLFLCAQPTGEPRWPLPIAPDGAFAGRALPAGNYALCAQFPWQSAGDELVPLSAAPIAVAVADDEVDLGEVRLPASVDLRVQALTVQGERWPQLRFWIELRDAAGAQAPFAARFADGGLVVHALAGRYRLQVCGVDLIAAPSEVELVAGRPATCSVAVRIGRARELVCNGDGGDRIRDPVLRLIVSDQQGKEVLRRDLPHPFPDLRGFRYWSCEHVFEPGTYKVEAESGDGLRYATTFVVDGDIEAPARIDLPRQR